jgi:hypothetical protein
MNRIELERFFSRIERNAVTGCWLWLGKRNAGGYGELVHVKADDLAHRFSYEAFVGPIPHLLHIDHLCRHPRCVNPAHLQTVLPSENARRAAERPASWCMRGHLRTPENTVMRRVKGGKLAPFCRDCAGEGTRRDNGAWRKLYRSFVHDTWARKQALREAQSNARFL